MLLGLTSRAEGQYLGIRFTWYAHHIYKKWPSCHQHTLLHRNEHHRNHAQRHVADVPRIKILRLGTLSALLQGQPRPSYPGFWRQRHPARRNPNTKIF